MDIYSTSKRSNIMTKIHGKETKHEIIVRKYLFSKGFRYRKNVESLPGKPDIVLPKYKAVIFINGCFWHGHTCKLGKRPQTNQIFWKNKIDANIIRDKKQIFELQSKGWKVILIWQCEIRNKKLLERRLLLLESEIKM